MKVTLADGTEVEVPDTNPIAVAARELERVQGLGYDTVEAYTTSIIADRDKLKKRTEEDQAFIDRQKNELGELRKAKAVTPEGKEDKPPVKDEPIAPEAREEDFRKRNSTLQETLTAEERDHAEKEFMRQYEESTPEERTLLKTAEGRNAFLQVVFPTKETDAKSPVGLFDAPAAPKLSISERVAQALKADDKGRGRRPVIPQSQGSGFTPKPDVKPVSQPMQVGAGRGGIREALQFAESQNK